MKKRLLFGCAVFLFIAVSGAAIESLAGGPSLFQENFSALKSSGGPEGSGGPDSQILEGYKVGRKTFQGPNGSQTIDCCVQEKGSVCDYGNIECVSVDAS